MFLRKFLASVICLASCLSAGLGLQAQELNCRIQINTDQIGGTDKAVYESFRNAVTEFLNTRHWTNLNIGRNEKIDCSFLFIFQETKDYTHTVEMQVQSRRPVFNSTYTTSLLNVRQSLEFDYQENQTLEYNANQVGDNLTATLVFWTYLILGMDFDSFSPMGGEVFFQQAQNIVSQAQGVLGDNWKAHSDDRNCWAWADALGDERQKAMRTFNYRYHRLGLDLMYDKSEEGRQAITESFDLLKEVRQDRPQSPLLSNLADTKMDEWIQLYSKADAKEKQSVYDRLVSLWPGQSNRLDAIKE